MRRDNPPAKITAAIVAGIAVSAFSTTKFCATFGPARLLSSRRIDQRLFDRGDLRFIMDFTKFAQVS
jgi:hypothetical protein